MFGVDPNGVASRKKVERRCPGAGPVKEELGYRNTLLRVAEAHGYEEEGAIRAVDLDRQHGVPVPRVGAVDKAAGEGGRIGNRNGNLNGAVSSSPGPSGGHVVEAANVNPLRKARES